MYKLKITNVDIVIDLIAKPINYPRYKLSVDIESWMMENFGYIRKLMQRININQGVYHRIYYEISFNNKADAMAFKLRWM